MWLTNCNLTSATGLCSCRNLSNTNCQSTRNQHWGSDEWACSAPHPPGMILRGLFWIAKAIFSLNLSLSTLSFLKFISELKMSWNRFLPEWWPRAGFIFSVFETYKFLVSYMKIYRPDFVLCDMSFYWVPLWVILTCSKIVKSNRAWVYNVKSCI